MKIKTYVVDDVEAAYPLIYHDLGQNAFILKTKPVKKGGLFGLFQKRQFEVVAAADVATGVKVSEPSVEIKPAEEPMVVTTGSDSIVESQVDATTLQSTALLEIEAPKKRGRKKATESKATEAEGIAPPKKRGRKKKEETVEVPLEEVVAPKKRGRKKAVETDSNADEVVEKPKPRKRTTAKKEVKPETDAQQEVLKELSEVKNLIQAMAKGEQPENLYPKLLDKWVELLRDQEVDEEVIKYVMKRMMIKHPNLAVMTSQVIEQSLFSIIEQLFQEGIDSDSAPTQPFITLVGPTGVGKTTTIAKLAAAQVISGRKKVGLLTTDTFRIAAVEQLKTYANILNVPCKVIGNADELEPTMQSLKGYDTVFMDSAGRNYLEGEYVAEINQYLRLDVPQENYLVLSMTTRWRDVKKIVEQMKEVPVDKLILTKWDETTCYGLALNMVYHYPYPLSYLCLGQGVPEDIMKADPAFMAKQLLGVG